MSATGRKSIVAGLTVWAAMALFAAMPAGAQNAGPQTAATAPATESAPAAGVGGAGAASGGAESANRGNPEHAKGPSPRVALVIGNSSYASATKLANPSNDARAVAQLLNDAKFEVIAATDLNREEMVQVMQDFAARIVERGPDTIALIYYAGHGLQVDGENYLVPIDARVDAEADIAGNTIRLVDVMATLDSVKSRTRVVILDACRNNPFAALGEAGKGLAIVDAPNGSIVAYSTAPGTEAYDGSGQNSPYTSAFLKLARAPNVPIEQFFKRVRLLVNDVTDGRQTPWESSSLTSDFYLFSDAPQAAAAVEEQPKTKPQPAYQVADIRKRSVRRAYEIVIEEDSVEFYEEFVEVYPEHPLAARIRALLASRLLMVAWHGAVKSNTPVAYQAFQQKFAGSIYAKPALKLQQKPKIIPISTPVKVFQPVRVLPNVKLPPRPVKLPAKLAPVPSTPFKPVPLSVPNKKVIKLPVDGNVKKAGLPPKAEEVTRKPKVFRPHLRKDRVVVPAKQLNPAIRNRRVIRKPPPPNSDLTQPRRRIELRSGQVRRF